METQEYSGKHQQPKVLRLSRRISCRLRIQASGTSTRLARVKRQAAIASEGASVWANRIKIEEVETARIAKPRPTTGGTTGLEECSTQYL